MKRVLVTGAAGFVGAHMVEHLLLNTDFEIVGLCRMSNVGDVHRILENSVIADSVDSGRVSLVYHDLKFPIPPHISERIGVVDYIIHLAANSHVDRSILFPMEFAEDAVLGTVNILDWARVHLSNDGKFLNAGTDEVFGPVIDHLFFEDERYRPSNPYAASKASQLAFGYSYFVTYGLPVISTHMMNIFGERQNSEKLIPKAIKRILAGESMPIHCKKDVDGSVSDIGTRCWLHARNAADAYLFLLLHGIPGEFYNVTGDVELNNKQIVELVAEYMKLPVTFEFIDFHKSRPGHDRAYGLNGDKLAALGWIPPVKFEDGLRHVVEWTMKHPEWLV